MKKNVKHAIAITLTVIGAFLGLIFYPSSEEIFGVTILIVISVMIFLTVFDLIRIYTNDWQKFGEPVVLYAFPALNTIFMLMTLFFSIIGGESWIIFKMNLMIVLPLLFIFYSWLDSLNWRVVIANSFLRVKFRQGMRDFAFDKIKKIEVSSSHLEIIHSIDLYRIEISRLHPSEKQRLLYALKQVFDEQRLVVSQI
jgi:hypothetical protein